MQELRIQLMLSTNKNDAVLLCPQAYNNPLPGSISSQLDYYTSKGKAIVSVTLTAMDIQGADLSQPLVLFWHHHAWNKLMTVTLSWLSFIPNTLSHLAPLLLACNWPIRISFFKFFFYTETASFRIIQGVG